MIETEVKILEINRKEVEHQLISLGAKKVFEGELIAIYYDFQNERLSKERNVLRLRKEGDKARFTLKIKKSHEKASVNQEHELEVSNFDEMRVILDFLGFKIIKSFQKTRKSYVFENVRIEFDKYHGDNEHIPDFIELESDNYTDIKNLLDQLNFYEDQAVKMDAFELIDYYQAKK